MRKIFSMIVCLIIFSTASIVGATELVILHTNDIHGHILSEDNNGQSIAYADLVAAIKNLKADNPDTLWLDAGDAIQGMPYVNISKGKTMVQLMNAAMPDAFTFGNHEFDFGLENLQTLIKDAKFNIVSANVALKNKKNKLLVQPYKIFKLPNNIKVGVFGLTTPDTAFVANPLMVKDVNFLDPVETARTMVKKLRSKCDVLIALTHLGVDQSSKYTSISLANAVKGIDLIVDAHSHTFLSEGVTVGKTLIVQTGCYAQRLGYTTLEVDNHKIIAKQAQLLDKKTVMELAKNPDPEVAELVAKIKAENDELLDIVIAHSDVALSGDTDAMRSQEMELGDLTADAFRWRSGADFAVVNGGGVRETLPTGNVTLRNTLAIFPFNNDLEVVAIQGKTIREMLELSVSAYPHPLGGFLQVSGIKFTFDPFESKGHRVIDIYINGELIDNDKLYKMAAIDFMLAGGDGYDMLKDLLVIGSYGDCAEALADYIKEVGTKNIDFGRIINIRDAAEQKAA